MKRKLMCLVLVLAFALTALGGSAAGSYPLTITDFANREVTIDAQPERLVSLTPSNTEILFALGAGDRVIGIDSVSNYPPEISGVPNIVGDYSGPNVELIISLDPDVVFASTNLQAETVEQLTSLGIQVVCVEPTKYEDIDDGIQMVADIIGEDAAGLIDGMKQKESAALALSSAAESSPKVYFALSFGEYGDWTAGPGTFIDTMITMAGGANIAANAEVSWPMYSLEQIISADPDVILISSYAEGLVEQFCAAEGYKELRAVKEGKVFAINADTSSRPGPRIVDALTEIAEALK